MKIRAVLAVLALTATSAFAQVYRWVDEKGTVHYSNAKPPGVVGLASVASEAYPDHTAWDQTSSYFDPGSTPDIPKWWMVDLVYVETFARLVSLDELRAVPELAGMPLVGKSRLSVQPVTPEQFDTICRLGR